jgi:hypothetical protein
MILAAHSSRIFMPRSPSSPPSSHGVVMSTLITWVHSLYVGVSCLRHEIGETLADNYRPELHYMRGPGPRWREKHADALKATNSRR